MVEITHNMSANIDILRKIDELSESVSGDEVTRGDMRTVEKLSVALWLGGGALFLSAVA